MVYLSSLTILVKNTTGQFIVPSCLFVYMCTLTFIYVLYGAVFSFVGLSLAIDNDVSI